MNIDNDLAAYYLKQPNPSRERASVLASMANNIPQDPYGFGAIAKVPAMALAGQEMRTATETDDTNRQAALIELQRKQAISERAAASKEFFMQFEGLMKNPETKATAVQFWNANAEKYIPGAQQITNVFSDQKVDGVKFENGTVMGIMTTQRGKMPVIYDLEKSAWRNMQPQDTALMMRKQEPGTPEGRRIYGELQDTGAIPKTPTPDPNNPTINRPIVDIYSGAMEKNLAQEAPDLYKTYADDKRQAAKDVVSATPNTDFELFYQAGIKAGKTPDQISREWSDQKVRIARESRPPREPKEVDPDVSAKRKEDLEAKRFQNNLNAFMLDYPDMVEMNFETGKPMIKPQGMPLFKAFVAKRGGTTGPMDESTLKHSGAVPLPVGPSTVPAAPQQPAAAPQANKGARTERIPKGAVPLNKTVKGKPAYQLPNGQIWVAP